MEVVKLSRKAVQDQKVIDMSKEPWGTEGTEGAVGETGVSMREQMMRTREEFQKGQDQQGFPRDNLRSGLKITIESGDQEVTGEIGQKS